MNRNVSFTFNVNGGQVNVANDNAIINASQDNGLMQNEINEIIKNIEESLSTIRREDAEKIMDAVEQVKMELENPQPKVSRLRDCVSLFAPMISIANGVPTLVSNLQKFQELIIQYIE